MFCRSKRIAVHSHVPSYLHDFGVNLRIVLSLIDTSGEVSTDLKSVFKHFTDFKIFFNRIVIL